MIRYILDKQVECDEEIAAVLDEYYGFYQGKDELMRVFPVSVPLVKNTSNPASFGLDRLTVKSYVRLNEAEIPAVIPYPIDTITIPYNINAVFFYRLAEKGSFYDGMQLAPVEGFLSEFGTVNTLDKMDMHRYVGKKCYVLSCATLNIPLFLLCEDTVSMVSTDVLIESMDYASRYPIVEKVVSEIKARLAQ